MENIQAVTFAALKYFFIILVSFFSVNADSQTVTDTAIVDSLAPLESDTTDTLQAQPQPVIPIIDSIKINVLLPVSSDSVRFLNHPFFTFTNPVRYTVSEKKWEGKEEIFYSVIGLLLFFAVIRNHFSKYVEDLFKVFLKTSMRQKQLQDQLLQNPLPSLLFNIFFILSAGIFLSLFFLNLNLLGSNYLLIALYCIIALAAIYFTKFIFLKIAGWIFHSYEAANMYLFIVFTTNKVLGISILPFLIAMAFTSGAVYKTAITAGIVLILLLFLYRYFSSFLSVRRLTGISLFHFILYLLAFEIIPLLFINKLLFIFFDEL